MVYFKALGNLKNLEFINFGDCLLKSKGAVVLTRALVQSPNIKVNYFIFWRQGWVYFYRENFIFLKGNHNQL